MRITPRRRALLVSAVAVAAVALAGCSSGSAKTTGTSSGSSSKPSPSPTFTGEVKIGFISDPTTVSSIGNPQPAAQSAITARVNAINAAGGINGNKVVLDACDEQGDPNKAMSCARKFVSEKVAAVVGDISLYGAQYGPILAQAGIPRVGSYATSQAELLGANSYLLSGGAIIMMEGAMLAAKQAGQKSLYALGSEVQGSSSMNSLLSAYAGQIGLQWKGVTQIPLNAVDMTSYVTNANKSGADTVLVVTGQNQTEQVVQTAVQLGAKWRLAALADVVDKNIIKAAGNGDFVTSGYYASPFPPATDTTNAAIKQFNEEMDIQQKSGDKNAEASKRQPVIAEWVAGLAFANVAKTITGPITAKSMTEALNTVKGVDLAGALPAWTPSNPGPGVLARVSNPYGWLVKFDASGNESLATTQPLDVANAK
jgi:ABC-type branched-subunit amino acid transport system substrate-binding protein